MLIGIDVGSTTVKAACIDPEPEGGQLVWSDYRRHETRQGEVVQEMLRRLERDFPDTSKWRILATGSGARPLAAPLGASFIQEVNAVVVAVEKLHPDAGSIVELGGQDAKIIAFKVNPHTGGKRPVCSMNDKCAAGTGATIEKCIAKVGITPEEASRLRFDGSRLHKVAAKCGVFAETDIVNLVKAGIPPSEVLCSLADAIVSQNLSVLARGNTLGHRVLLLGGPNAFLPFLRQCWRLRIPETWEERGHEYPRGAPLDELIAAPRRAYLYAAYGAALHGLEEPSRSGRFAGFGRLEAFLSRRGPAQAGPAGPALAAGPAEVEELRRSFAVPPFTAPRLEGCGSIQAAIGLDGGSTSSKAVLVDPDGEVLAKSYRLSEGNPLEDTKILLADLASQFEARSVKLDILGLGVTGYASDVLDATLGADAKIVETIAHLHSAVEIFGEVDVICDVGGQDIKVMMVRNGEIHDFRLSNQCSAGNGMLLQSMAEQFGVPLEEYAEAAFQARRSPSFSYGCAVFLDSDRVQFQKEGYSRDELLAGLASVLPKNVWQYVVQIPRLAELGRRFVLQGGVQHNLAAVKAQVDYIRSRVPGAQVHVHPHCGEAGAIGAALEALRTVSKRGRSRFIGMQQAIDLGYSTRTDESTRCRFCSNLCSRTFIDSRSPEGSRSRYISGYSCEKGTVESKEALRELVGRRNRLKKRFANLVEYEARLAFRPFYRPSALPGGRVEDPPPQGWFPRLARMAGRTSGRGGGFRRSPGEALDRRKKISIGIPRVLNLYSTAPFFRAYFETLGLPSQNVRFSGVTSAKMYQEGAKHGSVDPCFPAKAAQAHLHELLFKRHSAANPLAYIFFPSITHVPTFVENTMDSTSCPVVAGTPCVMRAAFTQEADYFARRGVEYVDGAATLQEPAYLKRQLFEMWGPRLQVTQDESDFAVEEGFKALACFEEEMQRRGLELIEGVEAANQVALLFLARPYHADPGLNHEVLEEFQALGYTILSIRSIPKDKAWLSQFFADGPEGRSPLDINDVWPENYSCNSVQKVWAAKFAARHPNIAVLDASSFKCGHDAPTYGMIDDIIRAAKKPYMALHDLDANKPSGSLLLRVRTYAYTLARYQEQLASRAAKLTELERAVAQRRRTLLAQLRQAESVRAASDSDFRRLRETMDRAFRAYLDEPEAVKGMRLEDLEAQATSQPPARNCAAHLGTRGSREGLVSLQV